VGQGVGRNRQKPEFLLFSDTCGGRGGIRTHGTLAGTPVFKTGALNHSATLPNVEISQLFETTRTYRALITDLLPVVAAFVYGGSRRAVNLGCGFTLHVRHQATADVHRDLRRHPPWSPRSDDSRPGPRRGQAFRNAALGRTQSETAVVTLPCRHDHPASAHAKKRSASLTTPARVARHWFSMIGVQIALC
jgi:hypothetical protein